MKEDFVTLEIAKKLKEKGYTGGTNGKYIEKIPGTEREEWDDAEMMYITVTDIVTYPNAHIYDVLKWLREGKGIYMYVKRDTYHFKFRFVFERDKPRGETTSGIYETYEQAVLAGIEYVLDNLI